MGIKKIIGRVFDTLKCSPYVLFSLYHAFASRKLAFILRQINNHLADREWLELDRPTIADIAAFPYIALVVDSNISLNEYPNILDWIDRIKKLPGFVGMKNIETLKSKQGVPKKP